LFFDNLDGLQLGTRKKFDKIQKLKMICRKIGADGFGGVETKTNWLLTNRTDKLAELFKSENLLRVTAAHNQHEKFDYNQQGGTMLMAFDHFASFVKDTTPDPTGLGRWVSFQLTTSPGIISRIIVAYMPSNSDKSRGTSVIAQHRRYLRYKCNDKRCPRQAWREDLANQMETWMENGERLILFADVNESVRRGKFGKYMAQLGLVESLSSLHHDLPETKSWFRGKNQITGVWCSPCFNPSTCLLLPFGFGVGDHRGIIIDIPTKDLLGTEIPTIIRPKARRLQSFIPKVRDRYLDFLLAFERNHMILHKYTILQNSPDLPTKVVHDRMEKLDKILSEGMMAAEKRCRKLQMGMIDFSPELNLLGKTWEVWKLIVRVKKGGKACAINRGRLKLMAKACNITKPLSVDLPTAKCRCAEAKAIYLASKPDAADMRESFMSENENIPLQDREDEADRYLHTTLKKEESRKTWRIINATRGIVKLESVREVTCNKEGIDIRFTDQEEVEKCIIDEVSHRFRLTEQWSPFRTGPLADAVGLLGDSPAADNIINGTFEADFDIDHHTKEIIKLLKLPASIKKEGPINFILSAQNFSSHWKHAKESTSSSISGMHFGHYKTAALNPILSKIHSIKATLCLRLGYALRRWIKGLQVMLQKIKGNFSVEKLRAILLIEADYNWITKEMIGRRLIGNATRFQAIQSENFGGVKGSSSIDLGACRLLFWDTLRQRRCAGGVASVDASNCYDRVVHNVAALAARRWGMPSSVMVCILSTISRMCFFLRTFHGVSSQSYGGNESDPFQGLCQGNGGAPGLWLCVACLLVDYMHDQGHAIEMIAPITLAMIVIVALLFVDDNDLLSVAPNGSPLIEEVLPSLQEKVSTWEGGLKVTGGALKPAKCKFQVVGHKWRDGKWSYICPASSPQLSIQGDDDAGHLIEYVPHTESMEVVGLWQAPDGNSNKQVDALIHKATEWATQLNKNGSSRHLAWINFSCCIWRSIAYPLPATTISMSQGDLISKALLRTSLPMMGIERSFPKDMRFSPKTFFGLDIPHPRTENGISKILLWMRHASSNNLLGIWFRISYEYLMLEINQPGCLFHQDYNKWSFLATDCWLKDMWRFVFEHKIFLHPPPFASLQLQRIHDIYLIPWFSRLGASNDQLLQLNRCRMVLRVMSLACISSGDGSAILAEALHIKHWSSQSTILCWPNAKAKRTDWVTWEHFIKHGTRAALQLPTQLGRWTGFQQQSAEWRLDPVTDTLYLHEHSQWRIFLKQRSQKARRGSLFHRSDHGSLPSHTLKAKATLLSPTVARYEGAAQGPILSFGLTPTNPWRKELQQCWLLEHSHFPSDLSNYATIKFLRAVSDGSHQPFLSETIGAAAWIMETENLSHTCNGATVVPGVSKDSYRPELTGILTILCAILYLCLKADLRNCQVEIACDNDSVVFRCIDSTIHLPTNIPEADILRAIYRLIAHLSSDYNISFTWKEVEGHADKHTQWNDMSRLEQLNSLCDNAAKQFLTTAINTNYSVPTTVPFEGWACNLSHTKVQGAMRQPLLDHIALPTARRYLLHKKLLSPRAFALVNWSAINTALSSAPSSFHTWASKHITGFCGTAHRQHLLGQCESNLCPACGKEVEKPSHVPKCTNPLTTALYVHKVDELGKWLIQVDTDPVLTDTILCHLQARGTHTFMLPNNAPDLRPYGLLTEQSFIGYDNFMMGMVAKVLQSHQHKYYRRVGSNRSSSKWASSLSLKLMKISHSCWKKRCRLKYGNSPDYLTTDHFNKLHSDIRHEYDQGIVGLLEEDHFLLRDDISKVLGMRVPEKQAWLHTIQLARDLAKYLDNDLEDSDLDG
jgi:hypothetical protein